MSNTLLSGQGSASVIPSVGMNGQSHISVLEPELVCSLPRRAHLTSGTRTTHRFLWNLFIGTFLILFFFARRDLETWDALLTRGKLIQASVTSKSLVQDKSGSCDVSYGFYIGQTYYSGATTVWEHDYSQIKVGDHLPITYLPETRRTIWQAGKITTGKRDTRYTVWIVWTVAATGLIGTILACSVAKAKKQLGLLQNGVAAIAKITCLEPTTNNKLSNSSYYGITYYYRVGHRSFEDTIYVIRETAEKYKQDDPCLSVLYDPQNPWKSLAYSQITAAHLDAIAISIKSNE